MNFSAGICPRCRNHLLLKQGVPFLICPLCGDSISQRESAACLKEVCSDDDKLRDNIGACLRLEKKYGPQLPLQVLSVLSGFFPSNEEIAYLTVRMSGFKQFNVKTYLENFSSAGYVVPFGESFLEEALCQGNMAYADLFERYIKNKIPDMARGRWLDRLRELRASYVKHAESRGAIVFIYAFYAVSALINIACGGLFIGLDMKLFVNVLLAVGFLLAQITVLFIYSKKYGSRVDISQAERTFMVVYMCSSVIIVGGVFLGWIL